MVSTIGTLVKHGTGKNMTHNRGKQHGSWNDQNGVPGNDRGGRGAAATVKVEKAITG